jgi:DNA replicative helicase MCM subunit Mcm2 (Cdc46/Mcm family)
MADDEEEENHAVAD